MKKLFLNEDVDVEDETTPSNTGLVDIIISSINSKWDSIRSLNSLIVNLDDEGYEEFIPVIEDILDDENINIGQLQHLVEVLSPNTSSIEDGKEEAADTLDASEKEM